MINPHNVGPVEQEMLDTVRVLEQYLPSATTALLQRWKGVLTTAVLKIDEELASTMMHVCNVCGAEEVGYRTELPLAWRERADLVICPQHEDKEVMAKLKKGIEALEPEPIDEEKTVDELMDLL